MSWPTCGPTPTWTRSLATATCGLGELPDAVGSRRCRGRSAATEDAAFIVQQNLRDVAPSVLASATWVERIAAFELLTGTPSPLRGAAPTSPAGHW